MTMPSVANIPRSLVNMSFTWCVPLYSSSPVKHWFAEEKVERNVCNLSIENNAQSDSVHPSILAPESNLSQTSRNYIFWVWHHPPAKEVTLLSQEMKLFATRVKWYTPEICIQFRKTCRRVRLHVTDDVRKGTTDHQSKALRRPDTHSDALSDCRRKRRWANIIERRLADPSVRVRVCGGQGDDPRTGIFESEGEESKSSICVREEHRH